MKLSHKLSAAVLVLIIGFGMSIMLLVNTAVNARELYGLLDATRIALRETNALMQTTQRFMFARGDISEVLTDFREQRESADNAMERLASHPELHRLSPRLRERLQNMQVVWDGITGRSMDRVEEGVALLLEVDLPDVPVPPGILRLQNQLNLEGVDPAVRRALSTTERNIDSAVAMFREFLEDTLNDVAAAASADSAVIVTYHLRLSLIAAAVVTVLSVILTIALTRGITRRVVILESAMGKMAERDFSESATVDGKDELAKLGENMNRVRDALSEFFGAVHSSVTQTHELQESLGSSSEEATSALNEISKNIEAIRDQFVGLNQSLTATSEAAVVIDDQVKGLGQDIETQAERINSVFGSIEEMNAGVQNVTHLSEERRLRAEEISTTVSQSSEIVQSTNALVRAISREIDDVLEVIEIINGVSEQTHLLSMNAAIESAHAGEAGKGFAVVAEEIQKLANSSAENAGRIEQNLRSMTEKVRLTLQASETSTQSLESIQDEMKGFSDAMAEISQNMQELSQGSHEVLDSTAEVSRITERIREGSHRMQSGSDQIRKAMEEADTLSGEVVNGVGEIDLGAKEILQSMVSTNEISIENREQVRRLEELLRTFRAAERTPGEGHIRHGDAGGSGEAAAASEVSTETGVRVVNEAEEIELQGAFNR